MQPFWVVPPDRRSSPRLITKTALTTIDVRMVRSKAQTRSDMLPTDCQSSQPVGPDLATAVDLPEELFQVVLTFLCDTEIPIGDDIPFNLPRKQLGRLALTCRYWAHHICARQFSKAVLRSRDDALAFLSFAKWNNPLGIAAFVTWLDLEYTISELPWIHLVFMASDRFPHARTTYLTLKGSSDSSSPERPVPVPLRSIHQSLPRSFPSSLSKCHRLTVRDVHFQSYEHLESLIRSINYIFAAGLYPSAASKPYTLSGVSWSQSQPNFLGARKYRGLLGELNFSVETCTEPWLFCRTLVARPLTDDTVITPQRGIPYVDLQDLTRLEDLFRVISQSFVSIEDHPFFRNCGRHRFHRSKGRIRC